MCYLDGMPTDTITLADILGPWVEPDWDSSLIARCRDAWHKPLRDWSRGELATLLRQQFALGQLLPVAKKKLEDGGDDDTEMYEGDLEEAIESASRAIQLGV